MIKGGIVIMDWLKKAPTAVVVTVVIVCGLIVGVVIAAFVVLELNGADTSGYRDWVGTLAQLLLYPLVGTAAVASISAAKSAARADEQTNGHLHERDEEIARLRAQLSARGR